MSKLPKIVRIESKRRQRTLANSIEVSGFGFWTSQDVAFSFRPAKEDSGIRFFRADLPNSPSIPARVEYRVNKPRQTSLASGSAQVDMVEHVIAALRGARIDNCDVVVNAPEAPGMDGSSKFFLEALLKAGTVEQQSKRTLLKVVSEGEFEIEGTDSRIEIKPNESGSHIFEYNLIYNVPNAIGNQQARFDLNKPIDQFYEEIARCRTFLTLEEANYLRSQGICARVQTSDVLVFGPDGPIDNKTHFDNECARHKLLDMIGDFALYPADWEGEFRAFKTGHQQNAEVLKKMIALVEDAAT